MQIPMIKPVNSYPVELLDEYIRLQEVVNDHQIRGVLVFKKHLELNKFRSAVKKTFHHVPLLRCQCTKAGKKISWKETDYRESDLFFITDETLSKENIIHYLKKKPGNAGPQILVQIFRQADNDIIIIIVNHMVFDGTGFKSYLYLLSEIYSDELSEKDTAAAEALPERRMDVLLKNIPPGQRFLALFRKTFGTAGKKILTGADNKDGQTRLGLVIINTEKFRKIKDFCRDYGITINDFVLTLFCRAIMSLEHEETNHSLTIQIMFDLRRYVKKYPVSHYGNFSSMESLSITGKTRNLPDLVREVNRYMQRIKTHLPGIKNIIIMNSLFKLLPGHLFDELLVRTIRALSVSTSNLGIIDSGKLFFRDNEISEAYMLTSVKNQPGLQLSFSTFKDSITMSVLGNYSAENWEIVETILHSITDDVDDIASGR